MKSHWFSRYYSLTNPFLIQNDTVMPFLLLFFLSLTLQFCVESRVQLPVVESGFLNLEGISDIDKIKIPLRGNWEVYRNQFLTHEDFLNPEKVKTLPKNPEYLKVPMIWNSIESTQTRTNGKKGWGFMTYRLRIQGKLPKNPVVFTESIATAAMIYCNGALVASSGTPGVNQDTSIPRLMPINGLLNTDCHTNPEIIIHVSNFSEYKGGLWSEIYLSSASVFYGDRVRLDVIEFLVAGTTIFMFIYHFVLWLHRRNDLKSLLFGIICLVFLFRTIGTSKILDRIFPDIYFYESGNKLEYIPYYLLVILFYEFLHSLFPEEYKKWGIQIVRYFTIPFILHVLFTTSNSFTPLLQYYQIFNLLVILFGLWALVVSIYKKRPGAVLMGIGFGCLIVTVVYDILASQRFFYGIFFAPLGFLTFLFFQASILSSLFAQAYRTAEHLSKNLTEEIDKKTRELEVAEKKRTAFFQNISDELRNPLAVIVSKCEEAVRGGSPIREKDVPLLVENSRVLLRLISQLLEIQSVRAGNFSLRKGKIRLVHFMNMVVDSFQTLLKPMGISLRYELFAKDAYMYADPDLVGKCLYNYLSNAVKFSPCGSEIFLRVDSETDGLRFTVRDKGPGIPENKKANLFDRYGFSEVSSGEEKKGSGIGLSLVKELIGIQGGFVGINQKEREGAEFFFWIPNTIPDDAEYADESKVVAAVELSGLSNIARENIFSDTEIAKTGGTKNTVLVVEDNPELIEYFLMILNEKGYRSIGASSGEEGIKKIKIFKPDILVTDLMLPGISGIDLIARIRESEEFKTMPTILLTSFADDDFRNNEKFYGADVYLLKPFKDLELIASVRNLLSLKSGEKLLLKEIQEARKIQDHLLPYTMPEIEHARFAAVYRPAESVGGDIYDFIELGPSRVGIFLADVSGHGIGAAMVAAMVKLLFSQKGRDMNSPAEFLEWLNANLLGITAGHFITCFYGILDVTEKKFKFSNAGHPPFLLYRGEEAFYINSRGKALGIFENLKLEENNLELIAKDRIYMYTDGVLEATGKEKEIFGEDRFLDTVIRVKGSTLEKSLDEIVRTAEIFQGFDNFRDDLTIVALEIE